MTQRVSKHGTRYTQGSDSTPDRSGGWPLVCANCSRRIYPSKEGFEQRATHLPAGVLYQNFHLPSCPPPL